MLNDAEVVPKFSCVHSIVIVSPGMAELGDRTSSAVGPGLFFVQFEGPISV